MPGSGHRVVVMGVSGCGKSTVGRALADALRVEFVEGDSLHPARNVALMASGVALTDADRHGWLDAIARRLGEAQATSRGLVVSCSALRRSYRDLLRNGASDVRFVHLRGDAALLAERLRARSDHYMPASLLQSQLDTLEPPDGDEGALEFDIGVPVAQICTAVFARLGCTGPP
jgi:gluconokinase